MILALMIGILTAGAVYLLLQRDFLRVILGFVLLSHAVNLLLFSSGGILRRGEPIGAETDPSVTADPLPQAFVLTAIVIAFAITIYLLFLAVTGRAGRNGQADGHDGDDEDGAPESGDEDVPEVAERPGPSREEGSR